MSTPDLPRDTAAERRLIAAISTDGGLLTDAQISPAEFFDVENRAAWERLTNELQAGHAVQAGDFWNFIDADTIFLPKHVAEDARRVRRAAYCRSLLENLRPVARACYAGDAEAASRALAGAANAEFRIHADSVQTSGEVAGRVLEYVSYPERAKERAIPTGLPAWDATLGLGLERSTLTVLMARPGMGKTAAMVQIADSVSLAGYTVLVLSKEMTADQWILRTACRRARVSLLCLSQNKVSEEDRARVSAEVIAVGSRDTLLIDDSGSQSVSDALASVQRRPAVSLVMADHLRLFNDQAENENKRLGDISWGFKKLAKLLDIPVLVAAQLNRGVEGQVGDKRPDLKDLRDSGEIEENADNVTALYREAYYKSDNRDGTAELINRKLRNGERNSRACYYFHPEWMSFEPLARPL